MSSVYIEKKDCCGCRACELVCPVGCIVMREDSEGFLYPEIDEDKCIQCDKCREVCRHIGENVSSANLYAYAGMSKDIAVRRRSSSGGLFWELGKAVIESGGVVFGALFNSSWEVIHKGTDTMEGLYDMCVSKYVQSDTSDTFKEVKALLEQGRKVLYSGTPCQIAGLKSFLQINDNNLICVSVICHGVPSPMVWRECIKCIGNHDDTEIKNIWFRNKENGWHCSDKYIIETSENGEKKEYCLSDYRNGFLQNLYLRPSCYQCRAKSNIFQADLILGDYWGIERYHSEIDDDMGCSAILVNSEKGKKLIDGIGNQISLKESKYKYIREGNSLLEASVPVNKRRDKFFYDFYMTKDIKKSIQENLQKPMDKQEASKYQHQLIVKYLENKIAGYRMEDLFILNGYRKVVLYAMCELTKLLYEELKRCSSEIQVLAICDKKSAKYHNKYQNIEVIGIGELVELCKEKKVDRIIIGNIKRENEIAKELIEKGIDSGMMISIISLIWGMGKVQ